MADIKKIIVFSEEVAKNIKKNFSSAEYVADMAGKFVFNITMGSILGSQIKSHCNDNGHDHDVEHH